VAGPVFFSRKRREKKKKKLFVISTVLVIRCFTCIQRTKQNKTKSTIAERKKMDDDMDEFISTSAFVATNNRDDDMGRGRTYQSSQKDSDYDLYFASEDADLSTSTGRGDGGGSFVFKVPSNTIPLRNPLKRKPQQQQQQQTSTAIVTMQQPPSSGLQLSLPAAAHIENDAVRDSPGFVHLGTTLRSFLSCSLCNYAYSDPIILACGHKYDHECISARIGDANGACPTCNRRITPDAVASAPRDYATAGLASFLYPQERDARPTGASTHAVNSKNAELLGRAQAFIHGTPASDYGTRLAKEIAPNTPLVECRCKPSLPCAPRKQMDGREFYGCPRWTKENPGASCGFYLLVNNKPWSKHRKQPSRGDVMAPASNNKKGNNASNQQAKTKHPRLF
jgi:hypothetical protein